MKKFKRIVTCVLCLSMLVGTAQSMNISQVMTASAASSTQTTNVMPENSFCADGGYYIKNNNGGVSFVGVESVNAGSYVIPNKVLCQSNHTYYTVTELGNGDPSKSMKGVYSIAAPNTIRKINKYAFYNTQISAFRFVSTPNSLTEIGYGAFGNTYIEYFDFSETKALKTIGDFAFFSTYLENIDMTKTTSLQKIGNYAFYQCPSIQNVILPYSLTTIGTNAFEHCNDLTNVTVCPNSSNNCALTKIGAQAFRFCGSLKTVTCPNTYNTLELGNNGIGVFEVDSYHKVTLNVPNKSTSKYRQVNLRGSAQQNHCDCNDVTAFKKGYLIIQSSKLNVYEIGANNTSSLIGIRNSTINGRVYPN